MATTPVSKSYMAKTGEIEQSWYHVDATDKVLGRLAVKIATVLMGKHRPTYTPHVDTGDYVIVTNAEKVAISGVKRQAKEYDWFTRHPGGRKVLSFDKMQQKHPERIIEMAVRRMLPKNRLGDKMIAKLKVYAGSTHEHQAQQPQELEI